MSLETKETTCEDLFERVNAILDENVGGENWDDDIFLIKTAATAAYFPHAYQEDAGSGVFSAVPFSLEDVGRLLPEFEDLKNNGLPLSSFYRMQYYWVDDRVVAHGDEDTPLPRPKLSEENLQLEEARAEERLRSALSQFQLSESDRERVLMPILHLTPGVFCFSDLEGNILIRIGVRLPQQAPIFYIVIDSLAETLENILNEHPDFRRMPLCFGIQKKEVLLNIIGAGVDQQSMN